MKLSNIELAGPFYGKAEVCESILRTLPEWFGKETALIQYLKDIEMLPSLLAVVDNNCVGFLTLKLHNEYAAELYVMGVRPEYHRQGIGRALVRRVESIIRQQSIEYWQVKTLASSHPDIFYAQTRAFYFSMGFRPLEVFTQLWGEANPCMLMVKRL
ncbi:GNAT family N-acetyltransferase [Hassallia byssoidea VB512170]|uniref:GNAT family N-acetyltransferase n=1 Tax=Hassallia byssoidea VB512170 TaxID=1304833 RepID=A0A846HC07_9CYAN|nr:GNAT family N-acetyltransferase [Hassalia byssoidea]NEU74583.1 GNAT family N-acetyltransferase [Hassalia byssoidea VB512170]